jgi:hypothetical protein
MTIIRWLLIVGGASLVSFGLLTPSLDRSIRAASALVGGVVIVIGLAPGRNQYQDPTHRVFRRDH